MRSDCDSEIDFRDLEIGQYSVIGYRSANTRFGTSYRIVIGDYPVGTGQTAETWAHTSLRSLLATSPEITQEKPALLHIKDKELTSDGKTRIRCTLILSRQEEVNPDALDLNFA
jgi:hypothetical protein